MASQGLGFLLPSCITVEKPREEHEAPAQGNIRYWTADSQTGWYRTGRLSQGGGGGMLAVLPGRPCAIHHHLSPWPSRNSHGGDQWGNAAKPQTHRKPNLSPPDTGVASAKRDFARSARHRTKERKWCRGGPASWVSQGITPAPSH